MKDKRSSTSAENGKKGGRPIGATSIEKEKAREIMVQMITANITPLTQILIDKGIKGDISAIKELFDRGFGKSHQGIGMEDNDGKDLTKLFVEIINAKDSNNTNSH